MRFIAFQAYGLTDGSFYIDKQEWELDEFGEMKSTIGDDVVVNEPEVTWDDYRKGKA